MDWDGNGRVTLSEFLAGADIGSRPIVLNGQDCIERFSLKDGRPVRVDCRAF